MFNVIYVGGGSMLGVLVVWHGWLVGWLNAINYAKPMPFADDDDYVTGRLVTPRHNVVIMLLCLACIYGLVNGQTIRTVSVPSNQTEVG